MFPTWMAVEKALPSEFTDNGFSTPWILRIFRGPLAIIATRYSPIEARVGRVHDWLFWFGRLPGAPLGTEHLTMEQANQIADNMLTWFGYERTGATVGWVLDRFGRRSWEKAAAKMRKRGLYVYQDYLDRLDREAKLLAPENGID